MDVLELNTDNFDETINSGKTVLVDFWATWCMPCKMQSPIVDELAEDNLDDLIVGKVNVDENPEIAAQFSVMSIPTIIAFKDGKAVDKKVGVTPKEELVAMVNGVKVS